VKGELSGFCHEEVKTFKVDNFEPDFLAVE
jgi:hypothetical protein